MLTLSRENYTSEDVVKALKSDLISNSYVAVKQAHWHLKLQSYSDITQNFKRNFKSKSEIESHPKNHFQFIVSKFTET